MIRRTLVAALLLAAVGIAVRTIISQRGATSVRASGPIVIVSIDTLRADRLPVYGGTGATTPNIDRLAAESVVFENAYAHSPQTLPSHTSILSGRLPLAHGVRDNIGFTVRDGERLLQHALKDAGFVTGGFVSSYVLRRQTGFHQGFDYFDDELPPVSAEAPLGSVQRAGADTIARAIRWIDGQPTPTFFLFAHIYEPHTPYTPPAKFAKRDPYDGEVAHADEIVGGLFEHLRRKGLYDDATIVLLSDHGEGLGDHGEEEHGIFLYRETIRVPLIVKLPGRAGSRRVIAPVQHIDVAPTLLDLAGAATATADLPGRTLLPALTGSGELPPAPIYSESLSPRYHFGWSELYALTDDRYRLIRAPKDELFDLAQDPQEGTSIAAERTQVHAAMRTALDRIVEGDRVAAPSAVSADDRERLAALGYVGTQTGAPLQRDDGSLPDPKDRIHLLRLYREAGRQAASGRLDDAAQAYAALLQEDPAMTDAWLKLASVRARQGRHEDALVACQQVISRNPRDAAALTGAASALLQIGRVDEAAGHAELAIPAAPAIAHEILARIAVHRTDPNAARRQARLASEADPTLPMVPFVDGLLAHATGDWNRAFAQFSEAVRAGRSRTEQLADLHYYAGDAAARLERYDEAERLFKQELALSPSHVRAWAGLAMLYRATGKVAESDQAIAELVRRSPTRQGYDVAAQLWTMFGEPGRAAAVKEAQRRVR